LNTGETGFSQATGLRQLANDRQALQVSSIIQIAISVYVLVAIIKKHLNLKRMNVILNWK